MVIANAEHQRELKTFLDEVVKKISVGENVSDSIKNIVDKFADEQKDLIESIIHTHILQHTI